MPLLGKIAAAVGMYFFKKHALELALDAIIEAAEKGAASTEFTNLDDKAAKALRDDREVILKIIREVI